LLIGHTIAVRNGVPDPPCWSKWSRPWKRVWVFCSRGWDG